MACYLYLQSKKLAAAQECLNYDKYLGMLSVQSKLKDLISRESSCGAWNRLLLLLSCNLGQFSFILSATSETLPTAETLAHSV